jgi:multidrug resistance efflux pump
MKKSFTSFFHKPQAVAIVSLIIALAIGTYGYLRINQKAVYTFAQAQSGVISDTSGTASNDLSLGFLSGGRIASVDVKTGDTVKKGQELAALDALNTLGTLTQAKAALAQAQANYTKVVNGATGSTIDVARAAVTTAQVNLSQATTAQSTLVANAKRTLLNSTIVAEPTTETVNAPQAPVISGTYTSDAQGTITLKTYPTGDSGYFVASGLTTGTGKINMTDSQPLGDTGLSILFPEIPKFETSWTIDIPNTKAPNYVANYNAYQSALETQTQTLAGLQAVLDQANTSLTALATAARPEDVASAQAQVQQAQGSLQIAEAAYQNTVIDAPYDGTITGVSIAVGQIAQANLPAIQLQVKSTTETVSTMIPKAALISRDGKYFVLKKESTGVVSQEVTIGVSDAQNVEILSGLSVGDEVVIY